MFGWGGLTPPSGGRKKRLSGLDLSQRLRKSRGIHVGRFSGPGDHPRPISGHFGDFGPDPLSETSTLAFNISIQHRHSTLAFNIGIQHWHSTLAFNVDIQHWHSTLALNSGIQHWHSTLALAFDIGIRHWHSTLAFNIDIQH